MFVGDEFYYADRNMKKPIKCSVLHVKYGYPLTIIAKREDTNKVFTCYKDFGCYELNEYEDAYKDAQIQEHRFIK